MRIFIQILAILMLYASAIAEKESPYETFKRTEYYTLKLTISQLKHGFVNNNSKAILKRISEEYRENGLIASKDECEVTVKRILSTKSSLSGLFSEGVKIFYNIIDLEIVGDSASASVEMVAYLPQDSSHRRTQTCQFYFSRLGGGWQVNNSDGWLQKMENLISPSKGNEKSPKTDITKTKGEY